MNVDLVADVGNSRIKWGVCGRVGGKPGVVGRASLDDDPAAWDEQIKRWSEEYKLLKGAISWAVAGVHPKRCDRLREWLLARGDRVLVLDRYDRLPLTVNVDIPERVGLDRLLNAVAACKGGGTPPLPPGRPAVLVDAGSAVTVDWLDEAHAFRGGAIFPGARLMARALHDYTALLPEVTVGPPAPPLPGRSTVPAMQAGVFWAVVGGVDMIARRLRRSSAVAPPVFLTGGDAGWIAEALSDKTDRFHGNGLQLTVWPEMTLEGVRLSAAALAS